MKTKSTTGPPMTLGNMRALGAHSKYSALRASVWMSSRT